MSSAEQMREGNSIMRFAVFGRVLLCGTMLGSAAAAQTADTPVTPTQAATDTSNRPSATADAATDTAPAEIVVTAQRRSQNAQRTSLAVTALAGDTLREKGVRDLQGLQNVSPALSFADAGILKFANIRGVGLNLQSPTVVSGVATYRDGLFAPSPIFLNEGIFDIASIEVLRGPQGTFVGQNSTGGAILQKTVSPRLNTLEGNAEVSGGNFGFYKAEGGLTVPLGPTLAVRIAGDLEHRRSFYSNLGPEGDKPGRVREEHGRVSLLWQPSAAFAALWKTEVNHGNNGGYPTQPIPGTRYAALDPAGDFTVNYDRTDIQRREFSLRSGLELNYTFDGGTVLRSISGYQYGRQHFLTDNDATSARELWQEQRIHDYVYSEEVNLISPDRGPFKWVIGGSYVRQEANLDLHIYNAGFPFNGAVFPTQDTYIDTLNPKTALGFFAQGTYKLTDTLTIEGGGRYSHDRQTQDGAITLSPTPPLPGRLDASNPKYRDNKWTGKVSLNWQVTPDHLLYAFVANGFKSGGVNVPAGIFKPERILDYEAGWKATLLGGHLRTQVDGFYMDYRDLQLNIFNVATAGSAVANAGKSTIYGAEAQAQARFGGFSADMSLAYVHSRVGALSLVDTRALPGGTATGLGVQCPTGVASNPPACFNYAPYVTNLSGQPNPYSPKWTASGGVEYAFPMGGTDTLTPRVDVAYLSSQITNLFGRPVLDALPARTLINAQLTYQIGRVRVSAYGLNVTNKHYRIGNDGDNTYYGAPRQYGVRLGVRF